MSNKKKDKEKIVFCGARELKKNEVRGDMYQCQVKGQIRYYGIEQITREEIEDTKYTVSNTKMLVQHERQLAKIKDKTYTASDLKQFEQELMDMQYKLPDLRHAFNELKPRWNHYMEYNDYENINLLTPKYFRRKLLFDKMTKAVERKILQIEIARKQLGIKVPKHKKTKKK